MPRSSRYSTHYHVGRYFGDAVYWHPLSGLSVEVDHQYLVELDDTDPDITWEPSFELIEALALNPGLWLVMPPALICVASSDDRAFGTGCTREHAALVEDANPTLAGRR